MISPKASISPPSQPYDLQTLIQSDPIISQYMQNLQKQTYSKYLIIKQLILDGIRYRVMNSENKQNVLAIQNNLQNQYIVQEPKTVQPQKNNGWVKDKAGNKHYNVAYIKHNRFLSPKQKKQSVTPKVTEMIPAKSPPHVIYGKPKVMEDQGYGCPYHDQECEYSPKQQPIKIKQVHLDEYNAQERKRIYNKLKKQWENQAHKFQKNNPMSPTNYQQYSNNPQSNVRSPGMMRTMKSPKKISIGSSPAQQQQYLSTKYIGSPQSNKKNKVKSRIKDLIDNDKHNKALQKRLKAQQNRLDEMEKKLKMNNNQKIGSKILSSKQDIFDIVSESDESVQFEEMNKNILQKLINKTNENKIGSKPNIKVSIQNASDSSFDFS